MFKHLFLTFVFTLLNLLLLGQKTSWSSPEALNGFSVSEIFSTSDSMVYVIKQKEEDKKAIAFDVFDHSLTKQVSAEVATEMDEVNHIALFHDELYVFGVLHHKGEDELVVKKINSNGELNAAKSLLTAKSYGGYHAHFDVSISPNQDYCAIIGSDGYSPDQKEIIHAVLFDTNWVEHHHQEIITTILSQKRCYNAITVNNDGVTYIMKRERKKGADKYYVFCLSESGSENHHELHLKSRNIMDMRFDLDTLGDLYLAGFYAPPYKSLFEGIYIKKINPEGIEQFSKEYLFNENVIDAFHSKKDIKEYGYGLTRFNMSHFGFVNEKNLTLEATHSTREKNKNDGYDYIQNGFVLISLSAKGGFQYATPIVTEQTDEEHKGYWNAHTHVSYKGKDLIYLNLLGDGAKKIKEDLPENAFLYPYQIEVSPNGTTKRTLQNFDVTVKDYAIFNDYKNNSSLPLLIVKSKNKDQYAIGLLEDIHE